MSLESVRAFFAEKAPDIAVIESPISSATVALAAEAYGVEPGRIAKTLSLRIGERVVLIVASGTARMDNKKVKALFGGKPKMLGVHEVADITGHDVGGVCPFGLKTPLPVYCDVSLKAFDEVVPAAGSTHSSVRIAPSRMAELTAAEWVDVANIAHDDITLGAKVNPPRTALPGHKNVNFDLGVKRNIGRRVPKGVI
jgi:prolyl-tRNA editing enzyme YbaK/EbsC (Cys-tRNA(Pro) deacylase)